jgi:thioredoxin-like negative regulator of GroEL
MKFVKVNIYKNRDLMKKYKIYRIPRFLFFEYGEEISDLLAVRSDQELYELFEEFAPGDDEMSES